MERKETGKTEKKRTVQEKKQANGKKRTVQEKKQANGKKLEKVYGRKAK
jgi:hypothetical protein